MATGVTMSFKQRELKRVPFHNQWTSTVSMVVSAATWNLATADHGFKYITNFEIGPGSITLGGCAVSINTRSATTAENGTIYGHVFTIGDVFTARITGKGG